MSRLAEFECCNRELYRLPARLPAPNGCLDLRLGASTKKAVCETCKKRVDQCAGHYGFVKLELPVFHVGYLKNVQSILQCVCKACSRVLLPPAERATLLRKMRRPDADALKKAQIYKRVVDRCKTQATCAYCGARNGTIRKVAGSGSIKLAHEKWRGVKPQLLEDDDEFATLAHECAPPYWNG